jgi:hypothetical protein
MAVQIQTNKTIYSNSINKVKNTTINTFTPPVDNTPVETIPTVDVFFENYDVLFFEIPKTGDNSHETLINRSSEYIGLNLQSLFNQLKELQIQNQLLQQQIDTFNNGNTN